jgi:hypothetical protein
LFYLQPGQEYAAPPDARTCNQTVMNGRIAISFVDFTVFSVEFRSRSLWFAEVVLVRFVQSKLNLDLGRCVLFGRR